MNFTGEPTIHTHPHRFVVMVACWFALAVYGVLSMSGYTAMSNEDSRPRPSVLALDPRLQATACVNGQSMTLPRLLPVIREATLLEILVPHDLCDTEQNLGNFTQCGIPAWSLMEWIADKQRHPVRWKRTNHGYRLESHAAWNSEKLGPCLAVASAALLLLFRRTPSLLYRKE